MYPKIFILWILFADVLCGTLKLDVDRRFKRGLEDNVATLNNSDVQYLVDIQIGTPPQTVTVQLDTGSSDLWLISENGICPEYSQCPPEYIFHPSKSETLKSNHSDFQLLYGDGTGANGTYYRDFVKIGDLNVSSANFGIANSSDTAPSVLGIGLQDNEAVLEDESNYSNLPLQMKSQGLIDTVAYSLWLGSMNNPTGQLLFGGIDHAKYDGSLITVPIVNPDSDGSKPYGFHVMLHGLWIYGSKGQESSEFIVQCAYPALLDSGSSGIALPGSMARAILYSLGAGLDVESGLWVVPCDQPGGLLFSLSGQIIAVPFKQVITSMPQDKNKCMLGIDFRSDGGCILGDTFLRSVYAVFDLENMEVSLAPMKDTQKEDLESITGQVPRATRAPSYSYTSIASDVSQRVAPSVFGHSTVYITTIYGVSETSSLLPSSKISQITASLATATAETASNGASRLDWGFSLLKLLLYIL